MLRAPGVWVNTASSRSQRHMPSRTYTALVLLQRVAACTVAPSKLKILCLHGYAQTGAVLRDRSGGFRKPFKKARFEMYYPDGPFGCTKDGEDEGVAHPAPPHHTHR